MKRNSKILTAIIFTTTLVCESNSQWVQIATLPVNKISAIKFFDENVGFACGGGVWKTTNGGLNWTQIFTAGTNNFCFLDPMNGFVSGTARIYKTTNGGLNWDTTRLTSGFTGTAAIGFFNALTGVSVGFQIINRTTNSGLNWFIQDSIYFQEQLSVSLLNNGTGWIAGGAPFEMIKKTVNYGLSWSYQTPGVIGGLNGVYALNQNIAYVCGHQGVIRRTTNGGNNWVKLDSLTNRSLKAIYFSNATSGNIVGDNGTIIRTTNSGNNLFFQTSPTSNHLYSIQFLNNETGWIGGNNGVLLKTTNGGGSPVNINQINSEIPNDYYLFQNYPNPFNPETTIKFSIKKAGEVTIIIFSSSGEELQKIINQSLKEGTYETHWNADEYSSGVYFYSLVTQRTTLTKKMILIK